MGDKAAMTSPVPPTDTALTARRLTRLSVGVAIVLIALKAFALGASGSVSILASLADSVLDLIASLASFYAVRWAAGSGALAPRFGRGNPLERRGDAVAALVQAGLVFASALFIGWEAVGRIFDPRPVSGGTWAVGVVVISIMVTAAMLFWQTRAMKASGSKEVAPDRAHYAADLAAGVVVLIGVFSGAYLGAPGLDAAAGLVVAVWLFWGAIGVLKTCGDLLSEREVSGAEREALTAAVMADPRIVGVTGLRARLAGSRLAAQMRVEMDQALSIKAAHEIVVEAERRVLAAFPDADLIISVAPRGTTAAVPVSPWASA